MDQTIINWVFGAGGAAFGWVLKIIWDAIKELKNDLKQIERDLPEVYVRRDNFEKTVDRLHLDMHEVKQDMKEGFRELKDMIGLLFKKLESKQDK
jgi:hypothetical protein